MSKFGRWNWSERKYYQRKNEQENGYEWRVDGETIRNGRLVWEDKRDVWSH